MKSLASFWHFWIPFILTCIHLQLVLSICLEDQRSLLLQLRSSLQYNELESFRLATWEETPDCCKWNGVKCNSSTGEVIGLDLSSESITSSIDNSSSLFNLKFLQSLNLAYNSFSNADFPTGFGKLSELTYLNLSNAGFGGQVPGEISQLVKLVTLDLCSGSFLMGSPTLKLENPSLEMLLRNFTDLRGLYLNGVVISASGSEWCKALSTSVPNLEFLSLSNCNLSGKIDPSLAKLRYLSEIHLDQNNLAAPVPDFMADFRNLRLLKLSSCQLIGTFPQKILKMPTLRSLDLSYNGLQGTLPTFPLNASLQTLVISYTNFSGLLPSSIGNLSQLQRIELQNCNFSGLIPPSVEMLDQLEYVDLSFNKFSGPIPSFSSARNLKLLHLSNNKLSGKLEHTNWSRLSNLVDLDLSTNLLQGEIPTDLFSLQSLQKMQLGQNRLTGQLRELPSMPSLILNSLDLSNNNIQGSVPKSLFGLEGLSILKLSYNNLSGPLNLNVIQHLRNLSTLELSYNSLIVKAEAPTTTFSSFPLLRTLRLASCNLNVLPEFLRNQSNLQYLDLSDNNIQGPVPEWIWRVGEGTLACLNLSCNGFTSLETPLVKISSLSVLDIHSNRIQGEVPTVVSQALSYLDCSNNNFKSLSPDFGNSLLYTLYLSVAKNNISQEIPATICNATSLNVLDMSFNSLKDKIPDCVIDMTTTLRVLNLKGNYLTSTVVDAFPENCSLSTINVGQNTLQGKLPRSLASCKMLEVLDLGRNKFHDTFPCWLKKLSNLRVLVLRANNFYGSFACPPSNMSWPVLQIVDITSNHFSGELTAQCFSSLTALSTEEDKMQSPTSQLQYRVLNFENMYYQDTVMVSAKGTEINLQKILTLFKCIDMSNNDFHGSIPYTVGSFSTLIVFNLSNNNLSGSIPSSIGNLKMLESLDLSHNNLSGNIPIQLSQLNFLSFLSLSFNNLEGRIPTGTQLQTFSFTAYIGNPGLCGPPLQVSCSRPTRTAPEHLRISSHKTEFDWQFILIGTGFGTGAALAIAPLLFWKKWRKWHNKVVDKFVYAILSICGVDEPALDQQTIETEDGIKHQLFDFSCLLDEDEVNYGANHAQFCLFCSKLDIERKRVVHNPRCSCHF